MRKGVSSQWYHSIGLALSFHPENFKISVQWCCADRYPFGYLAQQADHLVAILATAPPRTDIPFVGTVLHPSPIVQLIVRSLTVHRLTACIQQHLPCCSPYLHLVRQLLRTRIAAQYTKHPRHKSSSCDRPKTAQRTLLLLFASTASISDFDIMLR